MDAPYFLANNSVERPHPQPRSRIRIFSLMFRYDDNSSDNRMAFGPIIVAFRNSTFLSLEINWFVNVYIIFFLSNFAL